MSMLLNLLNLHSKPQPVEDFFTEVICHYFIKNNDVLIKWLSNCKIITINRSAEIISIHTQRCYDPLGNHNEGSRPDIVIEISIDEKKHIIFMESKIDSKENNGQLKKYYEILQSQNNNNCSLVYVTKKYEPKEKKDIVNYNCSNKVNFYQIRWHTLFYLLNNSYLQNPLTEEILDYMESKNMSSNNKFNSLDIVSLTNFNRAIDLMNQSLHESVSKKFNSIFGGNNSHSISLTQYQNSDRYVIYKNIDNKDEKFWYGLGFFNISSDNINHFPSVGTMIFVGPKHPERREILDSMKSIRCDNKLWSGHNLDKSNEWSSLSNLKSLEKFLSEEDHIFSLSNFFDEGIEQLKNISGKYENLPI